MRRRLHIYLYKRFSKRKQKIIKMILDLFSMIKVFPFTEYYDPIKNVTVKINDSSGNAFLYSIYQGDYRLGFVKVELYEM